MHIHGGPPRGSCRDGTWRRAGRHVAQGGTAHGSRRDGTWFTAGRHMVHGGTAHGSWRDSTFLYMMGYETVRRGFAKNAHPPSHGFKAGQNAHAA